MAEMQENSLTSFDISLMTSEIMNLRHELEVRAAEIVHLKEENSRFVRMVAHDLQNPLGVIFSFTQFLIDGTRDVVTEEQRDFVGRIANSAEFMSAVIADLVDISQMNAGKLTCTMIIFDVGYKLSECIKRNRLIAAEKDIKINFEFVEATVNISGDPERIEKVFNNILSNAIKYSAEGTEILVVLSLEKENVCIRITDCGIGIPVENQARIFVPFEKVARKGTKGEKGAGLGLAVAKGIIQEHRGKIFVESLAGKGSSFIVLLPLK
jgi:signal transduction histidine kinase